MTLKFRWAIAAIGAWVSANGAQEKPIPIRQVVIEATSPDTFPRPQLLVWQWPDGGVVVADRSRGRLLLLDRNMKFVRIIADSTLLGGVRVPFGSFIAMPYAGDTSVIVDAGNSALIFIDRNGKQVRLVALPRGQDARNIGTGYYGQFIDPQGRIVYRGNYPRPREVSPGEPPRTQDSTAVVRADYDRRALDTLIAVRMLVGQIDITPPGSARQTLKMISNTGNDDWAMLADGSIAVVRHQDYHIDWVYADGTRASTPKMPFDWRRLSDEEKQARIDTARILNERMDRLRDSMARSRLPVREELLSPNRVYATPAEIPDYFAPLRGANTLNPDADNRLWITPSTSLQARGGLLMDVVNKKGVIEERVQLPPNAAIAGFGPNGTVFLRVVQAGSANVLARARIVR